MRKFSRQLTANILIAILVFVVSLWIHGDPFIVALREFIGPALAYYGFHFLVSLFLSKYEYHVRYSVKELAYRFNLSWVISALAALLVLAMSFSHNISRQMILTNLFGLLAGEYLLVLLVSIFRESVPILDPEEIAAEKVIDTSRLQPLPEEETAAGKTMTGIPALKDACPELIRFLTARCPHPSETCLVIDSTDSASLLSRPAGSFRTIVSVHPLNRTLYINHFLEVANSRLQVGGTLVVCAETNQQRKARIMRKYPPLFNKLYYLGDYLVMRVLPKLPPFRQLYYRLTHGKSIVMSQTEILGRLCASGFAIGEELKNNGVFCVSAEKKGAPLDNKYATYGPVIHLLRIGQGGKLVKMYKLRTMYPYSEYIQDYVYDRNRLAPGGKIRDDFRVTSLGRFLRRHWLDELPGLWNWVRGDVKIVGVRPLSKHYFSLYSPELQQRRIRFKPGLIPPFYADLPETLEEIQASEMRYLDAYEKAPLRTDLRYFRKAMYNILWKGAKSG